MTAAEKYAAEVARIYAEAEIRIIEKISNELAKDILEVDWAERKYGEIIKIRGQIASELGQTYKARKIVAKAVADAWDFGDKRATTELKLAGITRLDVDLKNVRNIALRTYIEACIGRLESTHLRILRATEDIYYHTINHAVEQVLTGVNTRQEAVEQALRQFADKGVTGFVDVSGRVWELFSYSDMAVRTVTAHASVQGHLRKLQAYGEDLVIISDSPQECEMCRPWEGRVCSITGQTPGYPKLDDAIRDGLFHANCTHRTLLYIPGKTDLSKYEHTENPVGYADRMEQRYNERMIRRWRRREAAAITDTERKRARAKVREWNARQKEFIERTGRRRDRWREKPW